jgi:uncharacterized protein (DUF2062 family)
MKKIFRRLIPEHKKIKEHKHLQIFGNLLHNPNLWHLNRYSVAWAFSIGLFCAFLPLPFQMVIAAALAIFAHANVPISVILVWVTNPFTMPPMFYFCYKVGTYLMGIPPKKFTIEISIEWLTTQIGNIWKPLWLGSLVVGTILAILGHITIRIAWRIMVNRAWQRRKRTRSQRQNHHETS